ncbi:MAG: hypothetical protein KBG48_31325 [Kofleriaceae bacterium]|jgi:hypothetical protein|nr:hypothetical protein [Kofleriaceae bacterium]MBP9859300.1 hypothetical protein [Kofleriaceae bacterium]
MSRLVTAKVQGGVVVGADLTRLPDGTNVQVVVPDDEVITPEVEQELLARDAEADRGDLVSADEVLRGLRARRLSAAR